MNYQLRQLASSGLTEIIIKLNNIVQKNNKNIKIILVNAYVGNMPSLGLAYLASYLREKKGIKNIKILQKKFYPDLISGIIKEQADMVGYFSVTPGFSDLLKIIKEVDKQSPVLQLMGGPHLTALPDTLPQEIDVGVVGEGEKILADLVNLYIKYNSLPIEKLYDIKSLVFRDANGKIVKTERDHGVDNLDDLPSPARDLLNIPGYYPSTIKQYPTKVFLSAGVLTSRGCPYHCIFCQENVLNRFRTYSAERAVAEIEELINKYKANFIQIMDDQFLVSIQRLKRIVELIRQKQLHKKAFFYCYLRANQVTQETAQLLKQMGVILIFIGFESGSDRILKYLKDNSCSVEKNQQAYDICKQYGLDIYGTFIVGSPQETMDDVKKTYEFIKKNKMACAEVFMLTPLPGTKIWEYAKGKGLVSDNMDWDKLLIKMSGKSQEKVWLAKNIDKKKYLEFYKTKLRPLLWHYFQTANQFKITDLFNPQLLKLIIKNPKYYLSVAKQSMISVLGLYNK